MLETLCEADPSIKSKVKLVNPFFKGKYKSESGEIRDFHPGRLC